MATRAICCILLCIALTGAVSALPSSTFTQGASLRSLLKSYETSDIEEAFYVVQALDTYSAEPPAKNAFCELAASVLESGASVEDVYHAVFVSETLGCAKRANEKVAALLFNFDASKATTEEIFFATSAAFKLREKKHLSFSSTQFAGVIDALSDLSAIDGSVKNTASENRGTLYHSGLAFQAASLVKNAGGLSDDRNFAIELFKENIEGLLELYTETDDGVMFVDNNDSRTAFSATNAFLIGSIALIDDDELEIFVEADILDSITEHALANCPFSSLKDVYHFSSLMQLLTSPNVPAPIALSLPKTTFSSTIKTDGVVTAVVTDILGNAIPNAKVFLMKAASFYDGSVLYSNQQLTSEGSNSKEFQINFFTGKPQQGFYSLDFGVQVGSGQMRTTTRTIKVTTSISVPSININVVDTIDKETSISNSVKSGNQFTTFKTSYFYSLDVNFQVKNSASKQLTRVQQAFIQFSGENSEASFPISFEEDTYRSILDMKSVGKELWYLSGDYEVSLIIGDPFIDNSFVWNLGTVQLTFPPSLEVKSHENVYATRPEKFHTFRVPDKRPAESVSFAFTVATIAPSALLLLGLLIIGIPIQFPSGLGFIYTILFLATIFAIFASYAGFWFDRFNMFDTLGYLLVLGSFAVIFGHLSLSAKGHARVAAAQAAKKNQ